MRRGKAERNGAGLTGERLGLVHRYMVEAPPEPPPKLQRWAPPRREPAGEAAAPQPREVAAPVQRASERPSRPAPAPPPPAAVPAAAREETPPPKLVVSPPEPARNAEPFPQEPEPPAIAAELVEPEPFEAAPAEDLEPEHAAEGDEELAARELPIHHWVQAPGSNGSDADPEWPQALVRLGLERSLRARDRSRDRD